MNCFGSWDLSGLMNDKRNIIDHSRLTSTMAEGGRRSRTRRRGRERRSAPPLVTLGSRVGNPAAKFLGRRQRVKGCSCSFPDRQNGQQTGTISFRSLEQDWLGQHHTEYAGAWVAIEGACLIAQGSSALQVLDAARAKGYDQPLVVHIPSGPELPFGGW